MIEKIRTYEQLKGICQALYYQDTTIEEEKDLDITLNMKDHVFLVEISYIGYYTEAKFKNDLPQPYRYTMVLIVKVGDKVQKVVKDIVSELETIYNAELPNVRTEQDLKRLQTIN